MDYRDYYFNNRKYLHDVLIQTDNTMLGTVIDFAKMAIRGAFLLNGSAAIAALGMFAEVLLQHPNLGKEFYIVVSYLGFGAFFASFSCCMAYFTQRAFQSSNGEYTQSEMCETDIKMLVQQLKDNNYPKSNMSTLERIELNDMQQAIENNKKQQKVSIANGAKYETRGDILCAISVFLIFVSYVFFFVAMYQGYTALNILSNLPN